MKTRKKTLNGLAFTIYGHATSSAVTVIVGATPLSAVAANVSNAIG